MLYMSQDKGYANPDVLVTTEWVQQRLKDPGVRVAEVDYDPASNYAQAHVPGAVLFDWRRDLNDSPGRDILTRAQLKELLERSGVSDGTEIVLYGDFNNWFAAYAFWDLQYYGVGRVRLMDGGRRKWLLEDRPLSKDVPSYPRGSFTVGPTDESLRAYRDQVASSLGAPGKALVDVRGPKEFSGEITAPPEYPTEQAQRGGHIPGAANVPWGQAVNEADGTFRPRHELEALYRGKWVTPDKEVTTYCRIGERSSHSWFVLKHLLGYPKVRNYDGSWTEWGNSVKAPIER